MRLLFRSSEQHMNVASGGNKDSGKGSDSLSPKRISVTLPDSTIKKLLKKSLNEGRSLSNLAAFLLEQSLAGDSEDWKQYSAVLVPEVGIGAPSVVPWSCWNHGVHGDPGGQRVTWNRRERVPSISVQGVPESPLQTVRNVGVNDGVSRVLTVELVQRSASGST